MLRRLVGRRRQRPDGTRGAETLHGFVRLALAAALERIGGQRANAHSRAGSSAVGRELRRAVHSERGHGEMGGGIGCSERPLMLPVSKVASARVRDRDAVRHLPGDAGRCGSLGGAGGQRRGPSVCASWTGVRAWTLRGQRALGRQLPRASRHGAACLQRCVALASLWAGHVARGSGPEARGGDPSNRPTCLPDPHGRCLLRRALLRRGADPVRGHLQRPPARVPLA